MFVIEHTDGGRYVARPGSHGAYTRLLQHARTFRTREEAERELCQGNERVVDVRYALMG